MSAIDDAIVFGSRPKSTTEQLILAKQGGRFEGLRSDGTAKGMGWKGSIPAGPDIRDHATEKTLDIELDGKKMSIPSIVPTLTDEQTTRAANGKGRLGEDIVGKAVEHAKKRLSQGQSPYID